MDRYELVEGSSAKFWEADVTGTTLTVRLGRLGTQGQSKDKTFPDEAAAVEEKDTEWFGEKTWIKMRTVNKTMNVVEWDLEILKELTADVQVRAGQRPHLALP